MAKTVDISLTITGKDSGVVNASTNQTNYLEGIITGKSVAGVESRTQTFTNAVTTGSLLPPSNATFGATKMACVMFFTYNSAEATPYVTLVVDGENIVAGAMAAFTYTTSITITTTALANPVLAQIFYYPHY